MPFYKEIEHVALTDVGVKRSHNQDAFTVQKATDRDYWLSVGHLFIVADGMGGHAVGEKASAKAVQEIPLTYSKHTHEGPANALRRAFQEANAGINAIGVSNPEFHGLGTTATALVLRNEGAWIGHVGDSRAYRVRNGVVQQLTYDHSYAWEMARRLGVPPEELRDVKKNVIVRSLGPDPFVQVDVEGPHPLEDGDTFVLCSDGLSNLVPPEEIGAIVTSLPLEEATRFLIELANLRGGPDNITALVVRVGNARDSVVTPKVSLKTRLGTSIKAKFLAWNQRIPWPISVLLFGFLSAVGFVVHATQNWPGAEGLFALAIIAIIVGLVGLVVHARQEKNRPEPPPEIPVKASIYRQYPVRIDATLLDRWQKTTLQLKEQLEARQWQVDWPAYKQLVEASAKASAESDLFMAFRHSCKALALLSTVFNKHRPKEEGFKPKWDTP